jgi:hypothetical protein
MVLSESVFPTGREKGDRLRQSPVLFSMVAQLNRGFEAVQIRLTRHADLESPWPSPLLRPMS